MQSISCQPWHQHTRLTHMFCDIHFGVTRPALRDSVLSCGPPCLMHPCHMHPVQHLLSPGKRGMCCAVLCSTSAAGQATAGTSLVGVRPPLFAPAAALAGPLLCYAVCYSETRGYEYGFAAPPRPACQPDGEASGLRGCDDRGSHSRRQGWCTNCKNYGCRNCQRTLVLVTTCSHPEETVCK